MSYLLKFDGAVDYTFGPTWHPADRSVQNVVPAAKLPRTHGARQLVGYRGQRRLVIRGGMLWPGAQIGGVAAANLRAEVDNLLAALNSGQGDLYFGENDRKFRCCEFEGFAESYEGTLFDRILNGCEIPFSTGDPFRYSTQLTTDFWVAPSSASTRTLTVGGNAPTGPIVSIDVGGSGSQTIAFTFANNTTGESFTLSGTVSGGDVIVVDCGTVKSVEIGSVDSRTLFEGQFIHLAPGSNELEITYTLGTVASVTTTYWEAYL